ncbi:aspartyl protease AED3-like [Solanum stenotomum]|uniref:aspartyl protease AED3-like n=1 Tax=Solanum stenotomum TaxID=172797 RepID=UPI0020D1B7C0|nr:aspartyl protease AED3-like [Solanum stenotomum]
MATYFFFFFIFLIISTRTLAYDDSCSFNSKKGNSDLSVIHIYGKCSPFNSPKPSSSWINTVINMASKDPQRLSYLSSLVASKKPTNVPIASGQQLFNIGNYVVRVKMGTPGQQLYMVLDTSNDAAFVPCSGCVGCSSNTLFAPSSSTTYGSVDCSVPECTQVRGSLSCPTTGSVVRSSTACFFNQSYGGDSSFYATLSRDSLGLANDIVPNYAFGCISSVSGTSIPPQGLLGLGRGSMSLMLQSGSLYSGVFSYCLPSFKSYYFSGSLKLGLVGQPKNIKTTPLLKNPRRLSLYYVNLTSVSVGRVPVPIGPEHLAFDPNTGAGTVIDSGTVITRFVQPAYDAIRDEFRKQVNGTFSSLGAFDTCFVSQNEAVIPTITLHFEGMDLKLPMENTLIHSSATPLACLAIASAPNNVNSVLNVIANLQQQNLRIMFDTANSRVGIAREVCN